jgi:hypothetical protein
MKVKRFDRLRRCLLGGETRPIVASRSSALFRLLSVMNGLP